MSDQRSLSFIFDLPSPMRLDLVIPRMSDHMEASLTRSRVKQLIKDGFVSVDGVSVTRPSLMVAQGARIEVQLPPETSDLEPYEIPLQVLHEDDVILVIDKPSGLSMHPGAGNSNRTLANAIAGYLREDENLFPGNNRPGIVHRLDKDTTGVIVVARTAAAHAHLSSQFAERTVRRTYHALVALTPRANRLVQRETAGTISTRLGRSPSDRRKQAVLAEGGRTAVTHWRRLEIFHRGALLELRLETGRTHQIRVHMQEINSPVVGDKTYGSVAFLPRRLQIIAEAFGRQALHAASLEFTHPLTGERHRYETPLPDDMQKLVKAFAEYSE